MFSRTGPPCAVTSGNGGWGAGTKSLFDAPLAPLAPPSGASAIPAAPAASAATAAPAFPPFPADAPAEDLPAQSSQSPIPASESLPAAEPPAGAASPVFGE